MSSIECLNCGNYVNDGTLPSVNVFHVIDDDEWDNLFYFDTMSSAILELLEKKSKKCLKCRSCDSVFIDGKWLAPIDEEVSKQYQERVEKLELENQKLRESFHEDSDNWADCEHGMLWDCENDIPHHIAVMPSDVINHIKMTVNS